jgi:para-nitrobenzyl esterase
VGTVDAAVATGALRGDARRGHVAFLGIPYATSSRFRAPEPATPWTGTRDATVSGPVAPQDPLVGPPYRAVAPESEDCLSLNVYTPAADGGRRPVLFWIHGGGFSHGAGSQPQYDGGPLAARGDVVVVTINYRVGALGYLYLGAHGGDAWGAATNAGQLDQVLALRWVHDNIASLGGDPANVTIFGQSAGGVAVGTLLAMPAASGLFTKAILQSGTANRIGTRETASAATGAFLERLGIPGGDRGALLAASVPDLLRAQGARGPLRPLVDGDHVPVQPLDVVRDGLVADVPLLIGTARDEAKLYVGKDRRPIDDAALVEQVRRQLPRRAADRADEVVDLYRASRTARSLGATNHDVVDAVSTATRFRMPAIRLAETQSAHQPATYVYQVDWERGGLGACHGVEIPFVFGTLWEGANPAAAHLAEQMMDAWVAFARTGDPGHDTIGPWPAYDTNTRTTMIFGRTCGAEPAPFEEERAIWTSMIDSPAGAST